MHYGQILQSHALHFFHLSSPDLLFGFDSEAGRRNIVGVAAAYPEVAKQGVLLRKFGQEVIRLTAGKRVHGTGAIPGGVNRALSARGTRRPAGRHRPIIGWSRSAVQLVKRLHAADPALYDVFGTFRSNLLSLVGADGALDFYDGRLRARDADGGSRRRLPRQGLPPADPRGSQSLELHEISLPGGAWVPAGLVQGRPAGARAELRLRSRRRSPKPSAASSSTTARAS
jgi:coenzyme F420-reducing hydrogenase alpha subunit